MDRILQPQSAIAGAAPDRILSSSAHLAADPVKTPSDFARALRRRIWVVLAVALGVIVPGSAYVVRMAPVYRAVASMIIEPPHFDEGVSTIIPHAGVGQSSQEAIAKYVPNRLALLRGRGLAESVAADPALALPAGGDPAQELITGVQTRRLPDTNYFDVHLEGTDPERITKLLNALLERFADEAKNESRRHLDNSIQLATTSLTKLAADLKKLDKTITTVMTETPIFTPEGKSLLQKRLDMIDSEISFKRLKFNDLQHEERIAQFYPHLRTNGAPSPIEKRIAYLQEMKELLVVQLQENQRIVRKPDSDPASLHWSRKLNRVLDELERIQKSGQHATGDLASMLMAHSNEEIHRLEKQVGGLLGQMQETMPIYQRYQGLLREREQKERGIATMQERLDQFEFLAKTQSMPVNVVQRATEPIVPIRPNRALLIAIVIVVGIGLGVGLVCLLEYLDHRVKVPEHLTAGLALTLLGVVPRMRRLARNHRGGHLWTHAAPQSVEADAFRNIRASLVGLGGPHHGPIVTLLVTSAKEGEGKTTTALNLAATCARAGERVLLVDCDLRRPSLGEVFRDDDAADEHELGLVDVLRGEVPWQRTLVRTDIPNLDFLPAGDPAGIPIEILGSLELRQLVKALSGHYHRVIIDGPAVLGMADCRMLGRVVDATVLVVRSGAHSLSPLRRAKAMLDQSRVPLAGVVFNGLAEDFDNWSSYGSSPALELGARRRLEPPFEEPAAMAAAGQHDA